MRTVRVGVIGYGFMGKTQTFAHKAMPFYYDPPPVESQLKVVCTSRDETARAARAAGGFERCTTDWRDVVEAEDVDVVHVCTPNEHHFPALSAAMRAGKHIYVDKPLTATLEEAEELERLLPEYRGVAQVVLQYRFFPATLRARQLVEEGFLGPVTQFRGEYLHGGSVDPDRPVNWKSTAAAGGGVIRDLGSHILDLLQWLIGPFESVNCVSRVWAEDRPSQHEPRTRMKVDVEEAAVMLLRAPGGAIGVAEASKIATGTEDELRFEIHGRHGAMRFNLMQPNYLEVYDLRSPEGDYGGSRGWQRISAVQKYPGSGGVFPGPKCNIGWIRAHIHCLYSFLGAIADGTEAHPSLAEGIRLQRVLESARSSAESGSWVELPRPA
ncbi:MAG: Gfo/Idh/MocA family oxidoreductase [Candidatus Brocadiae bacterium]|nr:Gfo/Idh/MocA family oxidoreductase [Candidatus Brocadiia bacterium]